MAAINFPQSLQTPPSGRETKSSNIGCQPSELVLNLDTLLQMSAFRASVEFGHYFRCQPSELVLNLDTLLQMSVFGASVEVGHFTSDVRVFRASVEVGHFTS